MIGRRHFLLALCAGALAPGVGYPAQASKRIRVIGIVWERPVDAQVVRNLTAFKAGLSELGYIEGRDYTIEQRSAETDLSRLPGIIANLLAMKVDVIISGGTPSALAARDATRETPILTVTVGDPVGSGLVRALRRPGGNVTGTMGLTGDLYTKRLDLLRQIVPGIRRVGMLFDPKNPSDALTFRNFEAECGRLKLTPVRAQFTERGQLAAAFTALQREGAQGLIVPASSLNNALRDLVIDHVTRQRLPAIYSQSYYVEAGGLMSYATNNADLYHRIGAYVDKLFKGAQPADLPIEQPNKFELVINLKTARSMGIVIPDGLLISADKVIE